MAPDGVRFGGPDAVIEVRSPDDETDDKLPFFARLRVREVVVIDRDSKRVELFALRGADYDRVSTDVDGWLTSTALGVRFRAASQPARLLIEDVADPTIQAEI